VLIIGRESPAHQSPEREGGPISPIHLKHLSILNLRPFSPPAQLLRTPLFFTPPQIFQAIP